MKALSSERTESYKMLEAHLAKANAEKADLANRVKYLEIKLEEVIFNPTNFRAQGGGNFQSHQFQSSRMLKIVEFPLY